MKLLLEAAGVAQFGKWEVAARQQRHQEQDVPWPVHKLSHCSIRTAVTTVPGIFSFAHEANQADVHREQPVVGRVLPDG